MKPLDIFVSSKQLLRTKCERVRSRYDGGIIARKLLKVLKSYNDRKQLGPPGYFLSAPQIGIFSQVAVLIYPSLRILINPEIVGSSPIKIARHEYSLSFEGLFQTYRYPWVIIRSDNYSDSIPFGPLSPDDWDNNSLDISLFAQQAVAHLYGLLPFDFQDESWPDFPNWPDWRPTNMTRKRYAAS